MKKNLSDSDEKTMAAPSPTSKSDDQASKLQGPPPEPAFATPETDMRIINLNDEELQVLPNTEWYCPAVDEDGQLVDDNLEPDDLKTHCLHCVGQEKTVSIYIKTERCEEPNLTTEKYWPTKIEVPGTAYGSYKNAMVIINGNETQSRYVRIEETLPDLKDAVIQRQNALARKRKQEGDPFAGLPVATANKSWTSIILPSGKKLEFSSRQKKRGRALKTIWGHCSAKKDLKFSWLEVRNAYNSGRNEREKINGARLDHVVFAEQNEAFRELFAKGEVEKETYTLKVRFIEK